MDSYEVFNVMIIFLKYNLQKYKLVEFQSGNYILCETLALYIGNLFVGWL